MKLTNLQPAFDSEVERWLIESLDLTPYQKEKLRDRDLIRLSPYYIYKKRKRESVSILWRITILAFPIYLILIVLFMPIKFILTGNSKYSEKFFNNFHSKWASKIEL